LLPASPGHQPQHWNIARIKCLQKLRIRASLRVTINCKQDGVFQVMLKSEEV